MNLDVAISIAANAFVGISDKGGQPYILHCLHVMNQMPANDSELRQIAVLHDLIEDTDWTFEDLRKHHFSDRVIDGIGCLTKREFEEWDDYIKKVSTNYDAIRVKLADLEHNSCITRLKRVRHKDIIRIEKYHNAYLYLRGLL